MNENHTLETILTGIGTEPVPEDVHQLAESIVDEFRRSLSGGLDAVPPKSQDPKIGAQRGGLQTGDVSIIAQDTTQPAVRLVPDVPTDLADGILRGTHRNEQPPSRRHLPRRFVAMFQERTVRWFAVAAAIVIAFVGVGSWLKLNNGKSGIAFADVMQRLCVARTVTYNMTFEGPSQPAVIHKMMHMGPDRTRSEFPDGTVTIVDGSAHKSLLLQPAAKKATCIEAVGGSNAAPQEDFFDHLLQLSGKASEDLGQQEIDGRQATGFRAKDAGFDYVIWVDPATGLPIRIEIAGEQLEKPGTKLVMRDFAFDVPLDESLFSLDPPPGYTVERVDSREGSVVAIRLPATGYTPNVQQLTPREQSLVYSLKECANLNQGQFPQKFDKGTLDKICKKALKGKPVTTERGRATRVSLAVGRIFGGLTTVQKLPSDSDWHYAGGGVTLGQAEVPVCWWKPAGDQSYRVVFGDLSVQDLDKTELDRLTSARSPDNSGQ